MMVRRLWTCLAVTLMGLLSCAPAGAIPPVQGWVEAMSRGEIQVARSFYYEKALPDNASRWEQNMREALNGAEAPAYEVANSFDPDRAEVQVQIRAPNNTQRWIVFVQKRPEDRSWYIASFRRYFERASVE
ncbi:MAG: hypothetical protein HYY05_07595 [Chloroflexi bacterium]|nr:hypothetical protein [Chloroflexota bacterium]